MAFEVLVTSAPRGLKPGTTGFCTVLATRGIPPNVWERVETLSGYRHQTIGGISARNPKIYSHTVIRLGADTYHVLSKVVDAGRDYSGRSNKLAHHLILRPRECPRGGPAAVLSSSGLMRDRWDGHVGWIDRETAVPPLEDQPQRCELWAQVWGDAGWGGVLAHRVLTKHGDLLYLIYPDEVSMLDLFAEAIALLPDEYRWRVTFTTYDLGLADVALCQWRACPASSPQAAEWRKTRGLEIWDLTRLRGSAPPGMAATAGREGKLLALPEKAPERSPVVSGVSDPTPASPGTSSRFQPHPPELPPVATPAFDGVLPLSQTFGSPPALMAAQSWTRSAQKRLTGFWIGFLAGAACILLLFVLALVSLRFTPMGKVVAAAMARSQEISEGRAERPEEKQANQDEKRSGGEAVTRETNIKKDSQGESHSQEKPERNEAQTPSPKPPEATPPKSEPKATAQEKTGEKVYDNQESTRQHGARQRTENGEKADRTNIQAGERPSSQGANTGQGPKSGEQSTPLGNDLRESSSTLSSETAYEAQPISPLDVELESGDRLPAEIEIFRIGEKFYIKRPKSWPEQIKLVIGNNTRITFNLPRLEVKLEGGWKKGKQDSSFVFEKKVNSNDTSLVNLELRFDGGDWSISAKSSATARDPISLPDKISAKLGFWAKTVAQPQNKIWISVATLEIQKSSD